jgi:L-asparaginase/Glu-tRNA(Gln) amidotransferase subunit D
MQRKPKIVILGTGGTIAGAGSKAANVTGYPIDIINITPLKAMSRFWSDLKVRS